jgi:hypothetical protein
VLGVPARVLRYRCSRETIAKLQAIAWWNWSHEQLKEAMPDMRSLDIEAFAERYFHN